jgi:hypothetical protein
VIRTPRRRPRRSFAKFVRRFWIIGAALLLLIGWGCWRIVELPVFRVASLSVTGLDRASRADVIARAAIDPQRNVWLLNRAAIERRIEAIPYVATAKVLVRPPAGVTLEVRERTIDGCVRDGAGNGFTIDASRRVLDDACDDPAALVYRLRAPLAVRPGAFANDPELIVLQNDRRALRAGAEGYAALGHDPFGGLQATLRGGIVVKFGDDADLQRADLDGKERLVGPILAQVGTEGRAVQAVDVRAAATPVVEFRPPPAPVPAAHPHAVNKL